MKYQPTYAGDSLSEHYPVFSYTRFDRLKCKLFGHSITEDGCTACGAEYILSDGSLSRGWRLFMFGELLFAVLCVQLTLAVVPHCLQWASDGCTLWDNPKWLSEPWHMGIINPALQEIKYLWSIL